MGNLREETAHRLNECYCGTPLPPCPSQTMPMSVFEEMMYKVSYSAGYNGTKTEFSQDLASALNHSSKVAGLIIQKGSVNDFPDIGMENAIYIDTQNNTIYYWKDNGYYKIDSGSGNGGLEEGTILDGGNAFTD